MIMFCTVHYLTHTILTYHEHQLGVQSLSICNVRVVMSKKKFGASITVMKPVYNV